MQRPSRISLLFLAGTAILAAAPDDPPVVFRSDVSLVRVDAQVVDGSNRAITGLTARDFVLREDGRQLPIRNFATENMPMDVMVLLDVSASMRPHVERIANAAHQALGALREQDRMGIMVFDRSTRTRLRLTQDHNEVERALQKLLDQESFNGGTDITRGIEDAARYIGREGRTDARRAIVIVTDDQTELNRDVEGVSRALTRANATLCALLAPDAFGTGGYGRRGGGYPGGGGGQYPGGGYPGGGYPGGGGGGYPGGYPGNGPLGPLGGIILGRRGGYGGRRYPGGGYPGGGMGGHTQSAGTAEIAQRSGGDSMPVDQASALEDTLMRLRQRYALYFYLPEGVKPGEERQIEVALADSARRQYGDAQVNYRRTYMAPNGSGAPPSASDSPTVVSQAPPPDEGSDRDSTDDRPHLKRRPAVDEGAGHGASSANGPWRQADSSNSPAPAAPAANDQSTAPNRGTWRRVDEPSTQSGPAPQITPAPSADSSTQQPANSGKWRRMNPNDQQ